MITKTGRKQLMLLAGINRPIIPNQVTKLAESLSKMGCIRPIVTAYISFLDTKGWYIIDGQHRFGEQLGRFYVRRSTGLLGHSAYGD